MKKTILICFILLISFNTKSQNTTSEVDTYSKHKITFDLANIISNNGIRLNYDYFVKEKLSVGVEVNKGIKGVEKFSLLFTPKLYFSIPTNYSIFIYSDKNFEQNYNFFIALTLGYQKYDKNHYEQIFDPNYISSFAYGMKFGFESKAIYNITINGYLGLRNNINNFAVPDLGIGLSYNF